MSASAAAGPPVGWPLRSGERLAVCRYCGEWGIEDPTDPAPGVCPPCLGRVSRPILAEFQRRMDRLPRGASPAPLLHWLYARHVESGWHPEVAAALCLDLAAMAGIQWTPRQC